MCIKNNFTFAICAYKESPYLEEAILSVKKQTIPVNVLIATSTLSSHIQDLAEKYQIPLFVNQEKKGIASDWNFALSCIKTDYGMIAHQDDLYLPQYAEQVMAAMEKIPESRIAFTDYGDLLADGKIHANRLYLWVKRCILWAFYLKHYHRSTFWKKSAISIGNAICCPSVAYNLKQCGNIAFDNAFSVNLDWAMWLKQAELPGAFVFIPKVLMAHRIADSMETAVSIADQRRYKEDFRIMEMIWGHRIAALLMFFYKKAYRFNTSG